MGQKKGYKQSEEQKNKISQSLIKAHAEGRHTGGFKKGNNLPRFSGKQHTEEWKLDRSEKMKQNNPMKSQETVDAVMFQLTRLREARPPTPRRVSPPLPVSTNAPA